MSLEKCICQMCSCGRHRCPHSRGTLGLNKTPRGKPSNHMLNTEYQHKYGNWKYGPRRESLRPAVRECTDNSAMESKTMYTDTFVKHQLTPTCAVRPAKKPVSDGKPMELLTTYTGDFTGQKSKRPSTFKPDVVYMKSGNPFHNKTMYSESYMEHDKKTWDWCRPQPIKHKECIDKKDGPMESTTIMKEDFRHHEEPERAVLQKPKPNEVAGGKFEGDTIYNAEYTKKNAEKQKGIKPPNTYIQNKVEFVGTTTVMSDYQPIENPQPVISYKPIREYQPSNIKFEDQTTVSRAFRPWPITNQEKPRWAHPRQYQRPAVPLDSQSSYQEAFIGHPSYERAVLYRPEKGPLVFGEDPEKYNVSLYQDHYKQYEGSQAPKSFKIEQKYQTPVEKFATESSYQTNYKGDSAAPASLCKPINYPVANPRNPFDKSTTYQQTYRGDKPAPCLGAAVATGSVTKEDVVKLGEQNGHLYYRVSSHNKQPTSA